MQNSQRFILIDDNPIDLYIAEKVINNVFEKASIIKFSEAMKALDFLSDTKTEHTPSIIFLDIYMPEMDGFGFLQQFALLPQQIRDFYKIIIVTSSSNQLDIARANSNPYVVLMTQKPLTKAGLLQLLE